MAVRCEVCSKEDSKYKCPSCHLQYCSIDCYKEHKLIHAETNSTQKAGNRLPPKPPPTSPVHPAMNGVHKQPGNPFHALSSSHELQQLFSRYPHLRNQLEIIFNATLEAPQGDFGNSASIAGRNNPSRGRGRGRGRVRGGSGSGPSWTQERGFKSGLHRLKKSRDRELSEAEGLKEFSALALKLNEYEASFKSGSTSGNGALDAIRADLQAVGPEM